MTLKDELKQLRASAAEKIPGEALALKEERRGR